MLQTADALFYTRGVRNVGVDDIVAHAGVAKASLYHHFPSKDALIAEYLRRRDALVKAGAAGRGVNARPPREELLGIFDALAEWCAAEDFRGCAFQNAAVELADPEHPGHAVVRAHKHGAREAIATLARAAGLRDAEGVAAQLALLFEGALVTALVEGSPAPATIARAAAATLIQAAAP